MLRMKVGGFIVPDVAAAVDFYGRAFGLALHYMHPSRGYAEFDSGAAVLAFLGEAFVERADLTSDAGAVMAGETYSLEFTQTVAAPREVVWRAWTDAERVKAWYKPDETWSTPAAEIDPRIGGRYRITLQPRVGPAFQEVGVFLEVHAPSLLVYTLRFEGTHLQFAGAHLDSPTGETMETYATRITLRFEDRSDGTTEVFATQAGYRSEQDRDRHREGWPRFLASLAKYCAARRGDG